MHASTGGLNPLPARAHLRQPGEPDTLEVAIEMTMIHITKGSVLQKEEQSDSVQYNAIARQAVEQFIRSLSEPRSLK